MRTVVCNGERYVHEDELEVVAARARGTIGPYDAGSPMGELLAAALEGFARVQGRAYGVEVGDGWIVYVLPGWPPSRALSIRLEVRFT